jgi:hypothetical protein
LEVRAAGRPHRSAHRSSPKASEDDAHGDITVAT